MSTAVASKDKLRDLYGQLESMIVDVFNFRGGGELDLPRPEQINQYLYEQVLSRKELGIPRAELKKLISTVFSTMNRQGKVKCKDGIWGLRPDLRPRRGRKKRRSNNGRIYINDRHYHGRPRRDRNRLPAWV